MNVINVMLSGITKAIVLRPFQTKPKKDGTTNTYFQVALPKASGGVYPATHGVSPIALPHGLTTKVTFEGFEVPLTRGVAKSGNAKVSGSVDLEVDGKPMRAKAEISQLPSGKFWVRFSVTNIGQGGFTARTEEQAAALLGIA